MESKSDLEQCLWSYIHNNKKTKAGGVICYYCKGEKNDCPGYYSIAEKLKETYDGDKK